MNTSILQVLTSKTKQRKNYNTSFNDSLISLKSFWVNTGRPKRLDLCRNLCVLNARSTFVYCWCTSEGCDLTDIGVATLSVILLVVEVEGVWTLIGVFDVVRRVVEFKRLGTLVGDFAVVEIIIWLTRGRVGAWTATLMVASTVLPTPLPNRNKNSSRWQVHKPEKWTCFPF